MTIEETKQVLDDAVEKLNEMRAELAKPPEPLYIGDGVYAEYDPNRDLIRLWTERESGTHAIYLERDVFDVLTMFALRCGWSVGE